MSQVWELVCISLFEKKEKEEEEKALGLFVRTVSEGRVWVGTQCCMAVPCGKGENKLCFVSLTSTTLQLSAAALEIDPLDGFACFGFFFFFSKVQIHTNASHIWASLLHLEFTF